MRPWRGLFPDTVAADLLRRWAEPHRRYHGTTHLIFGLRALEVLGSGPLERTAFWFHDAVHSNTTPQDELASAALAGTHLSGRLPDADVTEVQRLILLTTRHEPGAGDDAGARLCDADLAGLAAPWPLYRANSAGIRAELPDITDEQWRHGRPAFMSRFLEREWVYHSTYGRAHWEKRARTNLTREIEELSSSV